MNPSRIYRLLKLIGLLQAGRGYNSDALAEDCQVSRRTIFRDLGLLRASGLPLAFDQIDQRYRLPVPAYLPPMDFTAEEALAMIVLCQELGDGRGLPFLGPARSAAAKLESSLPAHLREHLRGVLGAVEIHPPPTNPLAGHAAVYQQLLIAVAQHRCVRIDYDSLAERQKICTRLSPYRLLFSRRSWYVIGRSSLHRSVRTFNLARIGNVEILPDRYQAPRGFSIARHLRNAWHLIPEAGADHEVLVRFSPMVAQNVAEVLWHKTQRVTPNSDGTLDFRVTVSGLGEISWWILGYADQAEVIEPPELRRLVAQRAAETAARYARPAQVGARPGAGAPPGTMRSMVAGSPGPVPPPHSLPRPSPSERWRVK
jgi:proteasome accessory factor B